jgi:hypothetical protein
MKYKCIANPTCLRTFEYGQSLRAHTDSCTAAQNLIKSQNEIKTLEYNIALNYSGIKGLHANNYYPIFHHLDKTNKFEFKDRNQFNGSSVNKATTTTTTIVDSTNKRPMRHIRKQFGSRNQNSTQVQNSLKYTSGE